MSVRCLSMLSCSRQRVGVYIVHLSLLQYAPMHVVWRLVFSSNITIHTRRQHFISYCAPLTRPRSMRALPGGGTEIRVHISDVHAVMLRLAEMTPAEFERASQQSLALTSPASLQGTLYLMLTSLPMILYVDSHMHIIVGKT